ncbi:hypothetical protein ACFV1B_13415 [Streptomyces sp. NPDC059637]|uniref:hypothetical protein n=1 Tax=Streptomyces TaxID=1883 RepID=UPI0031D9115C
MRGPGRAARPQHRHPLPVTERKKILLRLDPAVHDAVARWAADELRSTNAQIEFLLRRALDGAGRMPEGAGGLPRRGRPRRAGSGRSGVNPDGTGTREVSPSTRSDEEETP